MAKKKRDPLQRSTKLKRLRNLRKHDLWEAYHALVSLWGFTYDEVHQR